MSNRHEPRDEQAQQTSDARGDRPDGHDASEPGTDDASFIAQFTRALADQLKRRGADSQEDRSSRLRLARRGTFAALSVPNYRRYFAGQAVSMIGTWMQATAQSWLVLTLTHSSSALGVVVALQTLPLLLLAPYGGVIADRLDKRRLLIALQAAMGAQALILGVLTVTGSVRVWQVGLLAALLGVNTAFANPAEQSFTLELVGSEHLRNAVTLNGIMVNVARTLGPAVAGILLATVGDGICFLLNAASGIAVVISLATLDRLALTPTPPAPRTPGQLREGLRYVRSNAELAVPLLMMAAIGSFTYEFQISLPVMASRGLHVGPAGFGFMTSAMGTGSIIAGLILASRGRTGTGPLVLAATGFGTAMTLATVAPSLPFELGALALAGTGSIAFMSTGSSSLQLTAEPEMRGRVMSLWLVAFQGTTPIGAPIVGYTMAALGARAGLGLGALACFTAAIAGHLALTRRTRPTLPVPGAQTA
jgi:MFS family permease